MRCDFVGCAHRVHACTCLTLSSAGRQLLPSVTFRWCSELCWSPRRMMSPSSWNPGLKYTTRAANGQNDVGIERRGRTERQQHPVTGLRCAGHVGAKHKRVAQLLCGRKLRKPLSHRGGPCAMPRLFATSDTNAVQHEGIRVQDRRNGPGTKPQMLSSSCCPFERSEPPVTRQQ